MKKMSVIIASLCVFSAAAMAADPVYSVNVVGYVSATNEASKWYMRGGPFAKIGAGASEVTITDILGTNIANGTLVYLWNGLGYVPENFSSGSWSPGTNLISRADGFWMRSTLGFQLTRLGEVPGNSYASNTVTALSPGLQILSYPYPVSCDLTNMQFEAVAANGDTIYKWNGLGWDTTSFSSGKWGVNYQFGIGEGFWYKRSSSATATNWVVSKPYSLQ